MTETKILIADSRPYSKWLPGLDLRGSVSSAAARDLLVASHDLEHRRVAGAWPVGEHDEVWLVAEAALAGHAMDVLKCASHNVLRLEAARPEASCWAVLCLAGPSALLARQYTRRLRDGRRFFHRDRPARQGG
jgi:hypothetical protein